MIAFARDVLGQPLDEWQQWVVIHAGELLPDGRPRFRKVLLLVSRQQGKTYLGVVLSLYWLYVEQVGMVLGTSTKMSYAAESWSKAVEFAQGVPALAGEIPKNGVRRANGEMSLRLAHGSRYLIAASDAKGGRSLTVNRLWLDELRMHHDYTAWDAAVPSTNAVRDAQIWCASNAGSDRSVVLNDLRAAALSFIETGQGDSRLGLFEWSAPPGASPLDLQALAQAAPQLGRRVDADSLIGDAMRAVDQGGEALTGFLTEQMCQRVKVMDPAIDPDAWASCLDPGDLSGVRSRVALAVDVSLDAQHATAVAAAVLPDGRVRVEAVAAWSGSGCTQDMRQALPQLLARIKPAVLGWLPAGPAAAVAADLAARKGRAGWPPAGVRVEEIRGEVTAVCMGLAETIKSGRLAHSGDPLLNVHVASTEKLWQGDAFRFTRKNAGHCDGTYALATAVHLARTMPAGIGKPRIVVASDPA